VKYLLGRVVVVVVVEVCRETENVRSDVWGFVGSGRVVVVVVVVVVCRKTESVRSDVWG
jgi:hypothetical protein